jgi:hemoglobin-like flavoprotein
MTSPEHRDLKTSIDMTPESILLVQQSFRWLLPEAEAAGAAFLDRLGREAPQVARLLPPQRRRLVAAFAFTIRSLDDFDMMQPTLAAVGARARALGLGPEDYLRFGTILLATMEQFLGRAWNAHLAAAWAEVWQALVAVMQTAAPENRAAA